MNAAAATQAGGLAAKAENAAKTEPPAKTVGLPVMGKFATLNHRNAAQARKRALT